MATKVYIARGTVTTWQDTAGTLVMTLKNLAASTGMRVGAVLDLGAGSTPFKFEWRFTGQWETTPEFGEVLDFYIATSDGTRSDGEVGAADAAVTSANQLTNLLHIGNLKVDNQTASANMTASGVFTVETRYLSPVVANLTVDNLKNTDDTCKFTITQIAYESQ